jgi:tRNA pseudouridine38-40 synthase
MMILMQDLQRKLKTYHYQIYNSISPSVLQDEISVHIRQPLNVVAMREAIQNFIGKHDFSSFRARGCQAKTPIRSINKTDINQEDKKITFIFRGTIFPLSANQNYGRQLTRGWFE